MNWIRLWSVLSLYVFGAVTLSSPARGQSSFAYVANSFDSTVSTYLVDQPTGRLTPTGTVPLGDGLSPAGLATDPLHTFLYVANGSFSSSSSGSISAFAIDPATGNLSPLPGSPYNAETPSALTVHPSGKFLYVAQGGAGGIGIYSLDAAGVPAFVTGTASVNGGTNTLAIHPSGRFLYTANFNANTVSFYTINTNSGALAMVGQVATGPFPGGVTLTPSGNFLFVPNENGQSVSVYSIDPNSGVPTPVPSSPFPTGLVPRSAVIHPFNNFAYTTDSGRSTISAFIIRPPGVLVSIHGSPFAVPGYAPGPVAASIDSSGKWLYVLNATAGSVSTFAIDSTSGALTYQSSVATGFNPGSILVTR